VHPGSDRPLHSLDPPLHPDGRRRSPVRYPGRFQTSMSCLSSPAGFTPSSRQGKEIGDEEIGNYRLGPYFFSPAGADASCWTHSRRSSVAASRMVTRAFSRPQLRAARRGKQEQWSAQGGFWASGGGGRWCQRDASGGGGGLGSARGGQRGQWRGIMQTNLYVQKDSGLIYQFLRGQNAKRCNASTNLPSHCNFIGRDIPDLF
jgi:hypothetical protein